MNWEKELQNIKEFDVENRVKQILLFIFKSDPKCNCEVSGLDATGILGNKLTQELNKVEWLAIPLSEVINIFEEGGQVFEMQLKITTVRGSYEIIIRDGNSVDIAGSGEELPSTLL